MHREEWLGGGERDKGEEARLMCGEEGQELSPCVTRDDVTGAVVTFFTKNTKKRAWKRRCADIKKTLGWTPFHKSSALCARCRVVRVLPPQLCVFMQQRSLLSFLQSERHGVVGSYGCVQRTPNLKGHLLTL